MIRQLRTQIFWGFKQSPTTCNDKECIDLRCREMAGWVQFNFFSQREHVQTLAVNTSLGNFSLQKNTYNNFILHPSKNQEENT